MREILFRGKRKDTGQWVEGLLVILKNNYFIINSKIAIISGNYKVYSTIDERNGYFAGINYYCKVVPETVGQYTGLTDKNGNKIFEGDVIKDTKDNDELLVVDGSTAFGFDFRYINDAEEDAYTTAFDIGISDDNTYLTTAVVVGNIYDNPELLEVEE